MTAFLKLWSADHLWSSRPALMVLQKKIEEKINSHYSWKSQNLEMTHGYSFHFFSQYWHFIKFITPPVYRLLTLLSATKERFKALWTWCFSSSFPFTSGAAPVTQPGTTRTHNRGTKFRTFSCIYDILNSFSDIQSVAIIERAKMLCSFPKLSVTSPTSQFFLQPFRRFTYVTAHSPILPLLHLRHSSFSNPSFASPASQSSLNSPGEPPMLNGMDLGRGQWRMLVGLNWINWRTQRKTPKFGPQMPICWYRSNSGT